MLGKEEYKIVFFVAEDTACFYVAEITLALEHLHRQVGIEL